MEESLASDSKLPLNAKHAKKEVSARASNNDTQPSLPSVDTESSKSATATEKISKKRILKRNVTTIANSQIPAKQVKQVVEHVIEEPPTLSVKQQSQSLLTKSSDNGPTQDSPVEQKHESTNSIQTVAITVAEPVTPPKTNKNVDTCSLSELESPVASLIFSQTTTATTTSLDESCSCVEDSENESTSLTQQSEESLTQHSQEASSVQQSQPESVVTDDFDSDYKHKIDTEDSDDCTERMNAKLCVERDVTQGNYARNSLMI